MNISVINTPQLSAYYDGIIHVSYRGVIDSHLTMQAYNWRKQFFQTVPINYVRGEIFDFRDVTDFMPGHLRTVQQASSEIHRMVDLSNVPAALIVANAYQMQTIHVAAQLTPTIERKQVVWTREEAFDFIMNARQNRAVKTS